VKTSILDSRDQIKELDKTNVLGSVEQLPDQIEHTWEQLKSFELSNQHKDIKNIVVNGMGGSALGARVIKSLYKNELSVPFEVVNHYQLPNYVDEKTLVVLSSYSGTTEETLAAAEDAQKRNAKIAVITAGGKLKELAEKGNYPSFIIDPKFNPSNQPRMAIGYSVFGQLGLFNALGLLHISDEEVAHTIQLLRAHAKFLAPESIENNTAKLLAFSALDKMLILISAEHLEGATHVFNNQLNENAKNLTAELLIPEMNHHYLESLSFPKHLKDGIYYVLFNSGLFSDHIQKRFALTKDVIEMNAFSAEMVMSVGKSKLQQVWEVIQLGAFTNFYLAMLNGVDPAPIPWVDYFKEKLAK